MRKIFLIFLMLMALGVSSIATADGDANTIFRMRERFIYNCLKFVVWPQSHSFVNNDDVDICITGDHMFAEDFMTQRDINPPDLNIHVQELQAYDKIPSCHILFIGRADEGNLDAILSHAWHKPVLTFSEISGFAAHGGIIEIATVSMQVGLFSKDKINLRINLKAARDDGLNIDARILQIAAEIIK